MEIFEGIVQLKGALFVRSAVGDKVILAAVVPEWRKNHDQNDELWIANITITTIKKFKPNEQYQGHTIDQILCSNMNLTDFNEILG